jgi:hypothetical protein
MEECMNNWPSSGTAREGESPVTEQGDSSPPQVLTRGSQYFVGPICGLWTLDKNDRQTNEGSKKIDLYVYSLTEIIVCEWLSVTADNLLEKRLVVRPDELCGPYFDSQEHIRSYALSAWPCSIAHHSEEDAEWAIDVCNARPQQMKTGLYANKWYVEIQFHLAIRGVGTRFNRIGYQLYIHSSKQAVFFNASRE